MLFAFLLGEGWSGGGALLGDALPQNRSDPMTLNELPSSMLVTPNASAYVGMLRLCCGVSLVLYFTKWEWSATIEHTIIDRIVKNVLAGAIGAHWLA